MTQLLTDEQERSEFETWASKMTYCIKRNEGALHYRQHRTQQLWQAWQAASRAIEQAVIEAMQKQSRVIQEHDKLPDDVEFHNGSIGKGCTFKTLMLRHKASQDGFKDAREAMQNEIDRLRGLLGMPTVKEELQARIDALLAPVPRESK